MDSFAGHAVLVERSDTSTGKRGKSLVAKNRKSDSINAALDGIDDVLVTVIPCNIDRGCFALGDIRSLVAVLRARRCAIASLLLAIKPKVFETFFFQTTVIPQITQTAFSSSPNYRLTRRKPTDHEECSSVAQR